MTTSDVQKAYHLSALFSTSKLEENFNVSTRDTHDVETHASGGFDRRVSSGYVGRLQCEHPRSLGVNGEQKLETGKDETGQQVKQKASQRHKTH